MRWKTVCSRVGEDGVVSTVLEEAKSLLASPPHLQRLGLATSQLTTGTYSINNLVVEITGRRSSKIEMSSGALKKQ
jgi:hypothetical protein